MNNTEMLKKNYEFKYVFQKGKYVSGRYIEIYVKKNRTQKNLLGIAISKKIAKSVKRNRIKRLIRENYRLLENELNLGNSMIILWKKNCPIKEATFTNINADLKNIFQKTDIIDKQ